MITTELDLLTFLDAHGLAYRCIEHPPVYTCAEAEKYDLDLHVVSSKNLFLCDKEEERFFLVVALCEKKLDLNQLAGQFHSSRLHFASEQTLMRLLGVSRGAVTMMGLVNDLDLRVSLWMDTDVWAGENFLCPAMVNTTTLVLSKDTLKRFFEITGHEVHYFCA